MNNIEGERSQSFGLQIEVSAPEEIYSYLQDWIELTRNPLVDASDQVASFPTGVWKLEDSVLSKLLFGINFDPSDGQIEFSSIYIMDGEDEMKGTFSLDNQGIAISLSKLISDHEQKEQSVNIVDLQNCLKPMLVKTKMTIVSEEERPGDNSFVIVTEKGNEDGGRYVFHDNSKPPMYEGYCFHLREQIPESVEHFSEKYREFAHIASLVTNAIYEAKGQKPPERVLRLEMPESPVKDLERTRSRLSAFQSVTGDIVLSGIQEDVRGMILVDKPNVTFDEIGGQTRAKVELKALVEYLQNPEEFRAGGVRPRAGAIIYGPKGVGKTLLGKAVASEAEATFFNVKISSIIHGLVGRTPKIISELFRQAKENQPAVIFIDEFDALAPSRDHNSDYMRQVTSSILVEMNGILDRGSAVVVIAATNRLDLIDDAMRRPQRFDLEIEVTKPDANERKEIIDISMKAAVERSGRKRSDLFRRLNKKELSQAMRGFSGADIEEVFQRALFEKVRAKRSGVDMGSVSTEDILREIKNYERAKSKRTEEFGFAAHR